MYQVSVVINCHREGILVYKTLKSVADAVFYAEQRGLHCQVIAALDRADAATFDVVNCFKRDNESLALLLLEIDNGDLGLSRNAAVLQSAGKYIAFVDGDDLISENWLWAGFQFLHNNPGVIAHPKVNIFFDRDPHWWVHIDDHSEEFSLKNLYAHNYWTALSYGPKEAYINTPYQSCPRESAFGFEDWHWNCEVIFSGYRHRVVDETTHFIRLKRLGSLNANCAAKGAVLRPTKFFLERKVFTAAATASGRVNELTTPKLRFKFEREKFFLKSALRLWRDAFKFTFFRPIKYLARKIGVTKKLLKFNPFDYALAKVELPAWSYSHLLRAADVEPLLFPSRHLMARLQFRKYHYAYLPIVEEYSKVLSSLNVEKQYSHIFIVPWLIKGGADLGIIHHVNALADNFGRKCLVITTESRESVWLTRLSGDVEVLELGRVVSSLTEDELRGILLRLVLDLSPSVLHVVNSRLGWQMLQKFGNSLKEYMSIFVSCYCDDFSLENEPVGYGREYLPYTSEFISAVFSDQKHYPRTLSKIYGYPSKLFRTLYFPTEIPQIFSFMCGPKVLWAGRVDRQKRPDVLIQIAKCMPDLVFDIWGTIESSVDFEDNLKACSNINIKGAYMDFSHIPLHEYGVFLYTSQWDGLPNVLLEVAARGLPIVSATVGGIPELVSENTGYPVIDGANPSSYVERIREVFSERAAAEQRASSLYRLVSERHSRENWLKQLEKEHEYLG